MTWNSEQLITLQYDIFSANGKFLCEADESKSKGNVRNHKGSIWKHFPDTIVRSIIFSFAIIMPLFINFMSNTLSNMLSL